MDFWGRILLYIIMACCVIGGLARVFNEKSGLAHSFNEGIYTMAELFIPIVGLMVSIPYLKVGVEKIFGGIFRSFGADPVVASAMIIPPDCGSYAMALTMGETKEILIIVLAVGYMCASTVTFNIPIGLSILDEKDHKYLALGAMTGFLSVPFGIFATYMVVYFTSPAIRTTFTTVGTPDYIPELSILMIFHNLVPIIIVCLLLAIGLKTRPERMIKLFIVFGRTINALLTLVVVASIIQHYTGLFTHVFGNWGFDPILADRVEIFRSIELLGSIAMMLTGTFPMVYLIRKYLNRPLGKLGAMVGLDTDGTAGLIACMANGIALFGLIRDMKPSSKVICVSFLVCAGYSLGDFIAFNVNFQPNLTAAVFIGQLFGGIIGIVFAKWLAVPRALLIEESERMVI